MPTAYACAPAPALSLIRCLFLSATVLATSGAYAGQDAQFATVDSIDGDACFSLGSGECKTDSEAWQQACQDWHRANSPDNATHLVITQESAPGLTAFLGQGATVNAEYFDCGRDGQPGVNSKNWLMQQETQKRQEEWTTLLEQAREQGPGNWQVLSGDTDTATSLTLLASRGSDERGAAFKLRIDCVNQSMSVSINWDSALEQEVVQVIERFDRQRPKSRIWKLIAAGATAVHPEPGEAAWSLLSAKNYAVRTLPREDTPTTAFFEPAGLAVAIEPYVDQCGLM